MQIQSDPDGDDPSHYFLHLYQVQVLPSDGEDFISSLGPTSSFAVSVSAALHPVSALDSTHIFTIGQSYSKGTYGNWNLYEFNGKQWNPLTSQIDATIPAPDAGDQPDFFGPALDNLDFLSPTQGWATNGGNFYHIAIANGVATWSQVYPAATTTPPANPATPSLQIITPPRTPGATLNAPANPGPCDPNTNNNNKNGPVNPGNMPLSVFNSLPTDMHTWYGAPNNDPPGYDSYPHAKGTGTYKDAITFAIADNSKTFKQKEEIYIPELEKYFVAEDTCAACADEVNQGRQDHIDLWTGDLSNDCEVNIKVPPTIYSSNPDPEPIHYLVVTPNDTADQNYTVNTQPFSCG